MPETLTVGFTTLHLPTLLFVTALVVAFTGTLLLMARGPKDGTNALAVWGVAMMIGALGLVVAAAGEAVPWISGGDRHDVVFGGDGAFVDGVAGVRGAGAAAVGCAGRAGVLVGGDAVPGRVAGLAADRVRDGCGIHVRDGV